MSEAKNNSKESLVAKIFKEYDDGKAYKSGIGNNGIYEQTKRNEKFMIGDQWADADTGDLPKPVLNVIKQIGDYKISNLVSNPITAVYDFEGIPSSLRYDLDNETDNIQNVLNRAYSTDLVDTEQGEKVSLDEEISAVSKAMTSHFKSIWERVQLDKHNQTGARKAYMSGSYVLYSYFNPKLKTGLYVDDTKKTPVKGDIEVEILDITNVYFGNPSCCDVQKQPYVIISQDMLISDIKREAKNNGVSDKDLENIKAGVETNYSAGNQNDNAFNEKDKAVVLTKFYRHYEGDKATIKAIKVCKDIVIKSEWDTGRERYPIDLFVWDEQDNCIYGHSEITELIPNQIAINRMLALHILSEMLMGMPKIIYNGEAIQGEITNSPGEIIEVSGNADVQTAFRYVNPAQISPNWDRVGQNLIENTKTISGATSTALGEIRPENTSAIIAVREAASMPLQPILNRFFAFIEDIARTWGEIILSNYGTRKLKLIQSGKTVYVPFDGNKYKDMLINVSIEVGQSTLWSVSTVVSTLNNLLNMGAINPRQFFERLPNGFIAERQKLIDEKIAEEEQAKALQGMEQQMQQGESMQGLNFNAVLDQLTDEELAALQENPDILTQMMQGQAQ